MVVNFAPRPIFKSSGASILSIGWKISVTTLILRNRGSPCPALPRCDWPTELPTDRSSELYEASSEEQEQVGPEHLLLGGSMTASQMLVCFGKAPSIFPKRFRDSSVAITICRGSSADTRTYQRLACEYTYTLNKIFDRSRTAMSR